MNAKELAEKMFSLAYAVYMERGNEMKATLEIEALLTEAFKKQEEEFYFQRKIEFEASINEAIIEERNECAKVAEDKQRTEALLFGPANCCSQSARTIAGRIKARLSKGTK